MRKIYYTIMLLICALAIASFLVFPIYKYDAEKIIANPNDTGAAFANIDYRQNLSSLTKEEKEAYKTLFKAANQTYYAYCNEDYDLFYDIYKYKYLNTIYEEQFNSENDLDENTSEETLAAIEKTLKAVMGDSAFSTRKQELIELDFADIEADIIEQGQEFVINYYDVDETDINGEVVITYFAQYAVNNGLLLAYLNKTDDEIKEIGIRINSKGITYKDILTAVNNALVINKYVFTKDAYSSLNLVEKIKAATKDSEYYNIFPLLGLFLIYVIIFANLFILLFKALNGMSGKKYPKKSFTRSLISVILIFLLLVGPKYISIDYLNSYHSTSYSYLLDYLTYGTQGLPIIFSAIAFIISLSISILGRFCRWGTKKKINN